MRAQFERLWRARSLPPSTAHPTGRVFPGRRGTAPSSLKSKSNSAPGNLPRALFAGGPPTALGRGVGETGAEEAVRCRCAGAANRASPLCPPRSAASPPRGAWGKTPSPPHPVAGLLWWGLWGRSGQLLPGAGAVRGGWLFFPSLPRRALSGAIGAVGEREGEETRRSASPPLRGGLGAGSDRRPSRLRSPGPCGAARRSWRQGPPVPPRRALRAKEDDFSP